MQKVNPKDVFLHLLATITLYISAGSFVALVFQYINLGFPDPLLTWEDPQAAMRWPIAILIIIFPVYIFTMRFLNKDYERSPEKRSLQIRKWLVYLTLFVAALIMIGDLVTLVYNVLEGELTARFSLKVATVLATAGAIFWYYYTDVKRHGTE